MASFVNYQATPQAENYQSHSRGIDRAQPNKAFGELFEGIGGVVDTTVKAIDNQNQVEIGKELQTGIDAIRGAQGVDAAVSDPTITGGETGSALTGGGKTPPGVSVATSEIARINQAYKDGRIGDTYYYSKVEALARQVRNKYPGYREIIDQKVSSIIGTNPANALRTSILQDLKQAQSAAQTRANSDESIIERGKEHLSPAKYSQYLQGNRSPEFINELKRDIQYGEVKKQTISSQKSEYELRKAANTAKKEDIMAIVTRDATDTVWKVMNDGIDAGGGLTIDSLNKKLAGFTQNGKMPTPEELAQLNQQFNLLENQLSTALDRKFTTPFGTKGQFTYAQEINDVTELNKIKEFALAPIRNMRKALTDGDTGLFTLYANSAKLMKDQTMQDILSRSDTARKIQAAQTILGPAFGQLILEGGVFGKAVSDLAKVITMDSVAKSATGDGNGEDILRDAIRESRTKGSNAAKEPVATTLSTHRQILSSKNVSDQALAHEARTWFNPTRNFLTARDLLTENSRQSVLQAWSSPEIVQNMARLKSSYPQDWANYKSWVESSTRAVFSGTIAQLQNWQAKPGTNGVTVVIDKQGRINLVSEAVPGITPGSSERPVQMMSQTKAVTQLNSALEAYRGIAKADGADPNAAVMGLLNAFGLKETPQTPQGGEGAARPTEGNAAPKASIQPSGLMSQANDRSSSDPVIELIADPAEPVDLEAQEVRRGRTRPTGPVDMSTVVPPTADLRTAINVAATELGISPIDLATVISYETGGKFDPAIRGGAGNRHIGLIQFGSEEQKMYGANQNQSVGEQMQAVVRYLRHRGVKPGMDILDVYSTINAGAPGLYNRSDAGNGGAPGTVRDKVVNQMSGHRRKALAILGETQE